MAQPLTCRILGTTRLHLSTLAPKKNPLTPNRVLLPGNKAANEQEKHYAKVGIIEFMDKQPRILGTIKQELTDFQVHEIDLLGRKVVLTDYGLDPDEDHKALNSEDTKFIHCTMFKQGLDHLTATKYISRQLGISPGDIRPAGRKDRMAQTSQRISFPNTLKIETIMKDSENWTNVKLGNFSYSPNKIKYGDNKGNHFKILIKHAKLPMDYHATQEEGSENSIIGAIVKKAMQSLSTFGFVNYFGDQRLSPTSYLVGFAMLQGDWKEVFGQALVPLTKNYEKYARIHELWKSGCDPAKLIENVPRKDRDSADDKMIHLRLLARHFRNDDYGLVYRQIPRGLKILYIASAASYLWNRVASYRIQKFGHNLIPGDIVVSHNTSQDESSLLSSENSFEETELKTYLKYKFSNTTILTEKDIQDGHPYSIYDVYQPVLGSIIKRYLNPVLQEYYENLLAEHKLRVDCFQQFKFRNEDVDVAQGFFRPLYTKPEDFDYNFISYRKSDELKYFMPSDIDNLKILWDLNDPDLEFRECPKGTKYMSKEVPEDGKIAVIVEFSLPSGSYATVALREIMQQSNYRY